MTILEAIVAVAVAFLGGAGVTAAISARTERWKFKHERQATIEDRAAARADRTQQLDEAVKTFEEHERAKNNEIDERLDSIEDQITSLQEAMRLLLLDRILHLAQAYISRGNITFEERRMLRAMHDCYHGGLNGNGDADAIMRAVDELPIG